MAKREFHVTACWTDDTVDNDFALMSFELEKYLVRRVLVSTASEANVLYKHALVRMPGLSVTPSKKPIYIVNLAGGKTAVEGVLRVPLTVRDGNDSKTVETEFLVVNAATPWNAILGGTGLAALNPVIRSGDGKLYLDVKGESSTITVRAGRHTAANEIS